VTTFKRITGLLAVTACLAAAGCGSDDEGEPIPGETANELQSRLNEIQRRFDVGAGACADIENDSRPAVDELIASIPDNVDAAVRRSLQEGFDRLFALSEDECDAEQQTETDTAPAPEPEPEPTTTVTVPPETTETSPPPDTQTETTPPETEEQIPPGQGGDAPDGGEGGSGGSGQGGAGSGKDGAQGDGGGALVPEDEG
jgi:hypothetical protein